MSTWIPPTHCRNCKCTVEERQEQARFEQSGGNLGDAIAGAQQRRAAHRSTRVEEETALIDAGVEPATWGLAQSLKSVVFEDPKPPKKPRGKKK